MLNMQLVKEEPIDHQNEVAESMSDNLNIRNDDVIIASYNVIRIENPKLKTFNVNGLSNILEQTKSYDISIRTDLKELKLTSKINDRQSVFGTKESKCDLKRKTFAVKLSRETGNAYFVPVNSTHTITYLDEMNRSSKSIDSQNCIFEDCCKMPHPTRNKHDQLRVEMKNYLYKPLKPVVSPDMIRKFMEQLFILTPKRSLYHVTMGQTDSKADNLNSVNKSELTAMDLINYPYWHMDKVNLCDINKIVMVDLKMEIFLRKVQVIRFEEILMLFNTIDLGKLLNILQNICYLIHGNWVIKSPLLYKFHIIHDSETKQSRLKRMTAAREFILWLFATNKSIKMAQLFHKLKKADDFEEILNRLTIRNGSESTIDFILPEDLNFISQYPMVAKKHHEKTKELLTNKYQEHLRTLNSG